MSKYVERFQLNGEDAWMQPSAEGDYCEWEPTALIIDAMDKEISDLRIERDALQKLYDDAAVDACRLSWMIEEKCYVQYLYGIWRVIWPNIERVQSCAHSSPREAIDAAMAADAKQQSEGGK